MRMPLSPEMIEFIRNHEQDVVEELLLRAGKYPGIDMVLAVEQIVARRHIREKLPEWHHCRELFFPSRLSTEQCSSALTAAYKSELIRGRRVVDLTGGLGVDSYYFSLRAEQVEYVEQNPVYCEAARWNFACLGAENITVHHRRAEEFVKELVADTIYLDPDRRSAENRRFFALSDCQPDILQLKERLLQQAQRVIVKISPMADLTETLRLLPETTEIHVVGVRNECKELLFVLENSAVAREVKVVVSHFASTGKQSFEYTLTEEEQSVAEPAMALENYLYEPAAVVLKAGAFKWVAAHWQVKKLHPHTHLYTSGELVADFPGRIFKITGVWPFSGKLLKKLARECPKANITVRNFPLSVAELRRISGIREGGDQYLFAATLQNGERVLIAGQKCI